MADPKSVKTRGHHSPMILDD